VARVLQRLVVLFAFAGAFLAPVVARAEVLAEASEVEGPSAPPMAPPAVCSLGALSSIPPPKVERVEHAAVDDIDDAKAGGMCDDRGACVVAPQRVHPVGSARIQVSHFCNFGSHGPAASIDRGQDDVPGSGAAPVAVPYAVLDTALLVPPASSELGPAFLPVVGGPRVGVLRGVDRPPR